MCGWCSREWSEERDDVLFGIGLEWVQLYDFELDEKAFRCTALGWAKMRSAELLCTGLKGVPLYCFALG